MRFGWLWTSVIHFRNACVAKDAEDSIMRPVKVVLVSVLLTGLLSGCAVLAVLRCIASAGLAC
jgi:hypothetical protein